MRNIRLLIEYEGTNYSGWQFQKQVPTIQGAVREAVKKLTGEDVELLGASRTDAGVHAFGQVASFKTGSRISLSGITLGLNHMLPEDIGIRDAAEAPLNFNPRMDSKGKTYIYKILNRSCRCAILRKFSWHVFKPLDLTLMRRGAAHFIGEKDFSSFKAADSDAAHSIREVTAINIEDMGDGLIGIEVKGTAFLRHMVRIMAGTLAEVGKGRLRPDDVGKVIEARDRTAARMTAPAQGLFLMKVDY
ncbi:MAG: tRNA pseudouridine(38-40) synthase TruA [Deltaproteobacteria bacterium]